MKVFLSWSGDLSRCVAEVFREWLPCVIQSVAPYVSSRDIEKGERWAADIAKELEESSFGILCVTPDNLSEPWLHFEAGALSKTVDRSRVLPFLFGVKPSDLDGPLLQFQAANFQEDDIRSLMHTLNQACGSDGLQDAVFGSTFDMWWPKLKEKLDALATRAEDLRRKTGGAVAPRMNQQRRDEVLEELLELSRSQYRLLKAPQELLPPSYMRRVLRESPPVRRRQTNSSRAMGQDDRRVELIEPHVRVIYHLLTFLMDAGGAATMASFTDRLPSQVHSQIPTATGLGLLEVNDDVVGLTPAGVDVLNELRPVYESKDADILRSVIFNPNSGVAEMRWER